MNRLEFYLGDLIHGTSKTAFMSIKDLSDSKNYDEPLRKLLIQTKNTKLFKYESGDIEHLCDEITLCKNRLGNSSVLLRCLNYDRHWKHYYTRPKDILFENKSPTVFWRGTTTGQLTRPANRFTLVETWFHSNIDVGFSEICQDKHDYKKYVKGKCDISTFLKHKYIISVEGNDKDSGLQWKLNSNSLVFMAKPRITSWLMETTLIPDYHYVLLKDDFSDLETKLNWCNENQSKCLEMIQHANEFMKQFQNVKEEEQLERNVINCYFKLLHHEI